MCNLEHMAICSFGAIIHKNKILLVKLSEFYAYVDHWNFPGGINEPHETREQAVVREIHEETGIHCTADTLLERFTFDQNHISIFQGTYKGGSIQLQLDEISDAGWFTKNEALELLLAYDIRNTIERLEF